MVKELTAQERAIIQQAILDRWNPHRLTWKIANHFDLSENQIRHIKSKATFKAEYARQLAIYQGSFDEIQLGRVEVGQDQPIQHVHAVHVPGVNVPPRATTCWLSLLIPTAECETGAKTTIRSCVPETSTPCR